MNIAAKPWPFDQRYIVTSFGEVIGPKGNPLKPRKHVNGYVRMAVVVDGKAKDFYVHRVVCETFHGGAAGLEMQVDHINGIRSDNRPENLRWASKAENLLRRNVKRGEDHHNVRLTDCEVVAIRSAQGSQSEIAFKFGLSRERVRDIRNRKARRYAN